MPQTMLTVRGNLGANPDYLPEKTMEDGAILPSKLQAVVYENRRVGVDWALYRSAWLAQAGYYAPNMIRAEIVNHENLGVPPVVFASFFPVVMETVREKLGDAWTGETQAAWDQLLGQLEDLVSEHSKS